MDPAGPEQAAQPEQSEQAEYGTPEGRRVIQLLWDPPTEPGGRGPKPRTNLAGVVAAGIAIADAEGLEALSMRKVAAELGVGVMSLYTYVPGRSELIELMIDAVYGQHHQLPPERSWRDRLEHWCLDLWRLYREHMWLLDYSMARMPLGPHVLQAEEALYATLADAGLVAAENVSMANVIRWQLYGAARSTISDAAEERRTGMSAEAYWDSRFSFWVTYFDYERFPTMAAIWSAGGFDDPAGWEIEPILRRLLDAIADRAGPDRG